MTYTFQITDDSPEAIRFLEYARTLPFVRVEKRRTAKRNETAEDDIPFERIPGLAYTCQERIASVKRGYEDSLAGRVISHEDLKKEIKTWWR